MPFGASRKGITMRDTNIVSPGLLSNGFLLRREAAKAISAIEIQAARTSGGKTQAAAKLSAFFADCVSKLAGFVEAVLPTVTTRVRTSATVATITFSEALQPSSGSIPLSSVVFSPVRVISNIATTGSTMVITGVGITAGDTITYTPPAVTYSAGSPQPKSLGVKDLAGNVAATFTGVLA